MNIDYTLLKKQNIRLVQLQNKLEEENKEINQEFITTIDGVVNFIEHIRDIKECPPLPEILVQDDINEGLPDKLTLLVTGSGYRETEGDDKLILRTDDKTIHLHEGGEWGKLANALVDRYNEHTTIYDALKNITERFDKTCTDFGLNTEDEDCWVEAKAIINRIQSEK